MTGGRFEASVSDDRLQHRLIVGDVQLSDAGQYTLKVTDNSQQSVWSSSAMLTVVVRQLTTPGTRTRPKLSPAFFRFNV